MTKKEKDKIHAKISQYRKWEAEESNAAMRSNTESEWDEHMSQACFNDVAASTLEQLLSELS